MATAKSNSPIDHVDVNEWKTRLTTELNNLSESMKPAHEADTKEWSFSLWDCFNPLDLCLISYCLPCVTFGKTYHRLHKGDMKDYSAVNTSCLLFCGSGCVGLAAIPGAMQRAEIRRKHHLKGDCLTDLFLSCCCVCCSLTQQEKETEALLAKGTTEMQYSNEAPMSYSAPAPNAAPAVGAPASTSAAPAL